MSRETVWEAVLNALRDLTNEEFLEFCHNLTVTEEGPHIRASEVEGKSRVQIMQLLVSRWAEEAPSRTVKILRNIGCNNVAQELWETSRTPPRFLSDEAKPVRTTSQDMSQKQLLKVAKLLGREWKQVAIYLDLSSQDLEDIQATETDVTMQKMNMLLKWKSRRAPGQATVSDLWGSIKDLDDLPGEIVQMLQGELSQQPAAKRKRKRAQSSRSQSEGHFVDRHRTELIERVSHLTPILDRLLQEGVLQQKQHDRAMEIRTSQGQLRFLYSGPLRSGGHGSKEVFMSALCVHEPDLVQELCKKGQLLGLLPPQGTE